MNFRPLFIGFPMNLAFSLFFIVCTGQQKLKTQAVFADHNSQSYANRILCNFRYPNHYNEVERMKLDAEIFYSDIVVNKVPDRGRWGNFYGLSSLLPSNPSIGTQKYEPHYTRANRAEFGTYPNEIYVSERLHEAANIAFSLSFVNEEYQISEGIKNSKLVAEELALAVWSEIVSMARDDRLDASNGGRDRLAGEPQRDNPTFAQTIRFDHTITTSRFNREGIQKGEPYYVSAMKIVKIIHSYGLIKNIIQNHTDFKENEQFVNYWILDWTRWAHAQYTRIFNNTFGPNWRDFERNYSQTQAFGGNGSDQAYTYYNSKGNGINRIQDAQRFTLNNRELIYPLLVKTYATYFENEDFEDWAFDVFKLYIALGIFPDGTHHEMYRVGSNQIANEFPMLYPELSMAILLAWAHTHEIGVKNGSLSDADKYWNYKSSLGSDDLYQNTWETSTSGGNKGLEMILVNIAGYLLREPKGGLVGNRYNQNGILIDNTERSTTIIYTIANRYYDNELFEDIITRNGYPAYKSLGLAGLPSEAGAAWGLYMALGGETTFLPAETLSNPYCKNIEFSQELGNEEEEIENEGGSNDEGTDSQNEEGSEGDINEEGTDSQNEEGSEGDMNEEGMDEIGMDLREDSLYPKIMENPIRENTLKIVNEKEDCFSLNLFDLSSRLLFQDLFCDKNIEIDMSFLPQNNLYIVTLSNLEYNLQEKVLY